MQIRIAFITSALAALFAIAEPVLAQTAVPAADTAPRIQSAAEALAQDAGPYAEAHRVDLQEAMRRLRAQEETVAITDRIADEYKERLAGISIEHEPAYRIIVLLTGDEAVPERRIRAGGLDIPVTFRTGAVATREQVVEAIRKHQKAIRNALPRPPGLGLDPRTGALVVTMAGGDVDRVGQDVVQRRVEALTGIPVQIRIVDRPAVNLSVEGGSRLRGSSPDGQKRYICTSGFVVTDGAAAGVATAAHCPDTLVHVTPDGGEVPLSDFVGSWGWAYRDIQIHPLSGPAEPLFYADSAKRRLRPVTSWRNRDSTRAGDVVCHRGESTGYSCAEVELVDFAPPGDLCGGPCDPTWVTVGGPVCKAGDSGAPVFLGTIAFGLVKGASYQPDGMCNYYFYMSTDYLPEGWSLLYRR